MKQTTFILTRDQIEQLIEDCIIRDRLNIADEFEKHGVRVAAGAIRKITRQHPNPRKRTMVFFTGPNGQTRKRKVL